MRAKRVLVTGGAGFWGDDVTVPLNVHIDEIYHLACRTSLIHSQRDFVQATKTSIVSLIGSRSKIEFRPLPEDDPGQRCPDITLANEVLRWSPKIELQNGLSATIPSFDALLSRPNEANKIAQAGTC